MYKSTQFLVFWLYSTTDGAGVDRVAEEKLTLKNWLFVSYFTSAQNYSLFCFIYFCHLGRLRNAPTSPTPRRSKMALLRNACASRKTARHRFKQHCTRGNSRLSLTVASPQRKLLFATEQWNGDTRATLEPQTRIWPAKLHWGDLWPIRASPEGIRRAKTAKDVMEMLAHSQYESMFSSTAVVS